MSIAISQNVKSQSKGITARQIFKDCKCNIIPCNPADKKPMVKWKEWQTKNIPEENIVGWFKQFKEINWSILTGQLSGIVVLDADDDDAIKLVESRCPPTPLTTTTPRGGKHFYYRHPNTWVKTETFLKPIGESKEYKLDVKGDGGYAIAPASKKTNGGEYIASQEWTPELLASLPVYSEQWIPHEGKEWSGEIVADKEHEEAIKIIEMPIAERKYKARQYLKGTKGSIEGEGASNKCLRLAMVICWGFALPQEEAIEVLTEWGEKESQLGKHGEYKPWKESEIAHKVKDATGKGYSGKVGDKVETLPAFELRQLEEEIENIIPSFKSSKPDGAPADHDQTEELAIAPTPETPPDAQKPPAIQSLDNGTIETPETKTIYEEMDTTPEKIKQAEQNKIFNRSKFNFFPSADLTKLKHKPWIVKNYIRMGDVFCFYGDTQSRKSFIMVDMAESIARKMSFDNQPTRVGKIAYIYSESGGDGIKKRHLGWMQEHKAKETDNLMFATECDNIGDEEVVESLIAKLKAVYPDGILLLIIDTLSKNFNGDENTELDQFAKGCERIAKALGCAVGFTAHVGKDASRGIRGGHVLKCNIDLSFKVEHDKTSGLTTILNEKVKEDPAFSNGGIFNEKVVELGEMEDEYTGKEKITTLVLSPLNKDEVANIKSRKKDDKKVAMLECLSIGGNFATSPETAFTTAEWRESVAEKYKKMSKRTFQNNINIDLVEYIVELPQGKGKENKYHLSPSGLNFLDRNWVGKLGGNAILEQKVENVIKPYETSHLMGGKGKWANHRE